MRAVPGLAQWRTPAARQQTFSIRGIVGGTGAATTSVYLDDTNLSKRSNGGVAQNNGVSRAAALRPRARRGAERSARHAVRRIVRGRHGPLHHAPAESHGLLRLRARRKRHDMGSRSELSNEVAAAFGGPLVQDKLGFRVSGIRRETGGWIDTSAPMTAA